MVQGEARTETWERRSGQANEGACPSCRLDPSFLLAPPCILTIARSQDVLELAVK